MPYCKQVPSQSTKYTSTLDKIYGFVESSMKIHLSIGETLSASVFTIP